MKFVKPQAGAYKDKTKPADVRLSNINAAKGGSWGAITGHPFTSQYPSSRSPLPSIHQLS